jgi:hypothetical protein
MTSAQQAHSFAARRGTPRVERLVRGFHGSVRVLLGRQRELTEPDVAVDRAAARNVARGIGIRSLQEQRVTAAEPGAHRD